MDQQQQPQWSPPPQQPAGWGGPGAMGPMSRPLGVTLSAVLFFVIGILAVLAGVLVIAGGALLADYLGSVAVGAGIFIGAIIIIIALLFLFTGWGLWGGKGWSRISGIILAVLGLLGGISSLTNGSTVYGIVTLVIWAGVIYSLWMAKAWFSRR